MIWPFTKWARERREQHELQLKIAEEMGIDARRKRLSLAACPFSVAGKEFQEAWLKGYRGTA
mgnify:CR=1 FL=1